MKLSTFLIALFAMIAVFSFFTWQRLKFDVEEEITLFAANINRQVPMEINASTDLIGARAEGKEMVHQFRLHGLTVGDMPYHRDTLRNEKISRARTDDNFRRLLLSGVRLSYEYFIKDELALRFSLDKSSLSEKG